MSDEEIFEDFLRKSAGQFKNLQLAVEIMTAYTADGFSTPPSEAKVVPQLFRSILGDVSAASKADLVDWASEVGALIGSLSNGFATLTGGLLIHLSEQTGETPQAILASWGNLAAQVSAEVEVRRFDENGEER